MTLSEILRIAIFGLIVGVIAKIILPGKDPGGIIITALIGIAGSFIGTFIGRNVMGWGSYYQAEWLMSIAGAFILLLLYRLIARPRYRQGPGDDPR